MEFPVIPIFWNFRPTLRGTPKISEWNFGKCLFHSLTSRNFRNFWSNGKRPQSSTTELKFHEKITPDTDPCYPANDQKNILFSNATPIGAVCDTCRLQTCRLADLQTCRLADLQTCRLADLQTCRLQTCRRADLESQHTSSSYPKSFLKCAQPPLRITCLPEFPRFRRKQT